MSYTTAEIACPGCMGPCGECRTYTEKELEQLRLQKLSDKELEDEIAYWVAQYRLKINMFPQVNLGWVTIQMVKDDFNAMFNELEHLLNEVKRREIP